MPEAICLENLSNCNSNSLEECLLSVKYMTLLTYIVHIIDGTDMH